MSDKRLIQRAAQMPQHDKQQLTRADWLQAAINVFLAEGVNAVRITKLADALGVTRGSFYWHFSGRDDLLNGISAFWAQKNARSVINATLDAKSLSSGLLELYACWLSPERFDPRLDMAMRDWARQCLNIKEQVRQADSECINSIKEFFKRMGLNKIEANTRARTTYFCQIGYYALDLEESLTERLKYLEDTIYILSGKQLEPELAKQFIARFTSA